MVSQAKARRQHPACAAPNRDEAPPRGPNGWSLQHGWVIPSHPLLVTTMVAARASEGATEAWARASPPQICSVGFLHITAQRHQANLGLWERNRFKLLDSKSQLASYPASSMVYRQSARRRPPTWREVSRGRWVRGCRMGAHSSHKSESSLRSVPMGSSTCVSPSNPPVARVGAPPPLELQRSGAAC